MYRQHRDLISPLLSLLRKKRRLNRSPNVKLHWYSQHPLSVQLSHYQSNETPTWCNTVLVLFLQSLSTCFGRKRPSSRVFKTSTAATGTCVIVAGKSSHLLIRAGGPNKDETPNWCNIVQVLFLQSHSTCFGRKRPSSRVFKTSTAATGTGRRP